MLPAPVRSTLIRRHCRPPLTCTALGSSWLRNNFRVVNRQVISFYRIHFCKLSLIGITYYIINKKCVIYVLICDTQLPAHAIKGMTYPTKYPFAKLLGNGAAFGLAYVKILYTVRFFFGIGKDSIVDSKILFNKTHQNSSDCTFS